MNSAEPISLLLIPWPSRRRTSCSRSVSGSASSSVGRLALAHALGQQPRDGRVEVDLAGVRGPDGRGHLLGLGVLEEVARRARLEGRRDLLLLDERGHRDDLGLGPLGLDPADGGDAVHVRHQQVHQHDVRLEPAGHRPRPRSRRRPRRRPRCRAAGRRRPRRPIRTTAWSSTMSTRIGGGVGHVGLLAPDAPWAGSEVAGREGSASSLAKHGPPGRVGSGRIGATAGRHDRRRPARWAGRSCARTPSAPPSSAPARARRTSPGRGPGRRWRSRRPRDERRVPPRPRAAADRRRRRRARRSATSSSAGAACPALPTTITRSPIASSPARLSRTRSSASTTSTRSGPAARGRVGHDADGGAARASAERTFAGRRCRPKDGARLRHPSRMDAVRCAAAGRAGVGGGRSPSQRRRGTIVTSMVVPLPPSLATRERRPDPRSARARIPARPEVAVGHALGSKPLPSSSTRSRTPPSRGRTSTRTCCAAACLTTLWSASWAIRYRASSTASGSRSRERRSRRRSAARSGPAAPPRGS